MTLPNHLNTFKPRVIIFIMVKADYKLSPGQKQVEQFWRARLGSFSPADEQRICQAYKRHVVGAKTHEEMGLIHSGIKKGKEDYASFYREISDILNPNEEELETLVSEGFNWAGLMCLLAEQNGYSLDSPAAQVVANMVGNK